MARNPLKLMFLLLCLGTTIIQVLAVIDLGIKQDMNAERQKLYLFSGVVTFETDTDMFTDTQLFGLARKAHLEMQEFFQVMQQNPNNPSGPPVVARKGLPKKLQPSVMSALAVGKSIYFASSMKKCEAFLYQPARNDNGNNAIYKALIQCQIANGEKYGIEDPKRHRTGAGCGEIWSMFLFDKDTNPNKPNWDEPKRMVVWGPDENNENAPMPPCGQSNNPTIWGCEQVVKQLGVTSAYEGGILAEDPGNELERSPKEYYQVNVC